MVTGGFFSLRQRHRSSDRSTFTVALNPKLAAQLPDALLHATQTNPDPCPGFVKAFELLCRKSSPVISYSEKSILIIRVQTYIHGFAARMPQNVRQTLLQNSEKYKFCRLRQLGNSR